MQEDDGWADVLAAAKANGRAGSDQAGAHSGRAGAQDGDGTRTPEKMDFANWEFVFTNGAQADQDVVWNAIKGKAIQMNGTIISTTPTEFHDRGQFG